MNEEEDYTNDKADASHDNVRDSQERVLPPEEAGRRDDNALGPFKRFNPESVVDVEPVAVAVDRESARKRRVVVRLAPLVVVVNPSVQLPEVWKCSGAHPDDEVLVHEPVVVRVSRV